MEFKNPYAMLHPSGFRSLLDEDDSDYKLILVLRQPGGDLSTDFKPITVCSWPKLDENIVYVSRMQMVLDALASYLTYGGSIQEIREMVTNLYDELEYAEMEVPDLIDFEYTHEVEVVFHLPDDNYLRVVEDDFTEQLTYEDLLADRAGTSIELDGSAGHGES